MNQRVVGLLDLFAGRRKLILYRFMFGPRGAGWPAAWPSLDV
ncbi:MAG: DUF899 family protein [Verrucomicrobia bacterium]|nr:DUF899 family protein [Verrucomicrobiota bacterium]